MSRVVVVGAGVAGTAAAWAAARAGAEVTVVDGGTGESTLATGAIDSVPWSLAPAHPIPVPELARQALESLGEYSLPEAGARLLSLSGIVRTARGHDAALLDVAPLSGARIGVVQCARPGWDASVLARSWGGPFEPVDAVVLRHSDERGLPDADFAMRHDDEARLQWLAERLREARARAGLHIRAFALPPCLGVERARARVLSEWVGVPCGEVIAQPGGPSGLRFEGARNRALSAAGVVQVRGRATHLSRLDGGGWRVSTERGTTYDGDAVVLATGGLIGGGIEYAPAESIFASALPPFARLPFRLTLDAPVSLGARGLPLELPSSLFGLPPEEIVWPFVHDGLFERVGALSDERGCAGPGLYVAGRLQADRPRTWIDALAAGVEAGAGAAAASITSAASSRPSSDARLPNRP